MKEHGGGGRRSPPKLRGGGGGPAAAAGKVARPAGNADALPRGPDGRFATVESSRKELGVISSMESEDADDSLHGIVPGCDDAPLLGSNGQLSSVINDPGLQLGDARMEDDDNNLGHELQDSFSVDDASREICMGNPLHNGDVMKSGELFTAMEEGLSSSIFATKVISNGECLGMGDSSLDSAGGAFCMGVQKVTGSTAIQRSSAVRPIAHMNFSASKIPSNPPSGLVVGMDMAYDGFGHAIHGGNSKVQPIFGAQAGLPANGVHKPSTEWSKPALVPLTVAPDQDCIAAADSPVKLDVEEVRATIKKFDSALVGWLFGRRLPFNFLNTELHRQWLGYGSFRLITVSGDCFICFFDSVEARNAILLGGPWVIAGQVVGVDYWSPQFSPSFATGFITPVWVRLPGLPLYCWGEKNIGLIANRLGTPVWMDSATNGMERGHFARVCVRMDLTKPLKPGLWVEGPFGSFFQKVEYEGLSSFCFKYGHVGHKAAGCSTTRTTLSKTSKPVLSAGQLVDGGPSQPQGVSSSQPSGGVLGDATVLPSTNNCGSATAVFQAEDLHEDTNDTMGFGPWMLVARKKRPPRMNHTRFNNSQQSPLANASADLNGNTPAPTPIGKCTLGGPSFPTTQPSAWADDVLDMENRDDQLQESSFPMDSFHDNKKDAALDGKGKTHKSTLEREVHKLGPITSGGRNKKRKKAVRNDGGDASSSRPP